MTTSRRGFARLLGMGMAAPAVVPVLAAGGEMSLWERAELEVQQTGQVSAETARALLDAHGPRGIYGEPGPLEELRAALARKLRDHQAIRAFEVPADVEPLVSFRR